MGVNPERWDTFAQRLDWVLREERSRSGRSRREIAEAAGFHQNRLSQWTRVEETEEGPLPQGETLQGLLLALPHVNARWLLVGQGHPYGEGGEAIIRLGWIREALERPLPSATPEEIERAEQVALDARLDDDSETLPDGTDGG